MPDQSGMTPAEQVQDPQPPEAQPDYKAMYEGLKGNFKQVNTENAELKRQIAEFGAWRDEVERRQREDDKDTQEESSIAELERLVNGDPEELREKVQERVKETKAQKVERKRLQALYEQQVIPQVRQETFQQVQQMYFAGVQKLADKMGISVEEMQEIAQTSEGKFDEFFVTFGEKAIGKKLEAQKIDVNALRASILEDVKAQMRGDQPTPDTGGTGDGKTYNTFDEIEEGWLNGEVSLDDYKKARSQHLK